MSGGPPGTTVQALSASALIWSFFQQHPLASQVKETEQYVRGKQSNKQSK
jgi:hypothetical protein